jgi:biopolymer transport protein ExbD
MKIRTPIPEKKSRLEIIPLIDIMFFLLASFMMISLQMQIVRTVKANLPTATLATPTKKPDLVNLDVDRDGQVSVDDKPMPLPELLTLLTNRYRLNTNLPVYITPSHEKFSSEPAHRPGACPVRAVRLAMARANHSARRNHCHEWHDL